MPCTCKEDIEAMQKDIVHSNFYNGDTTDATRVSQIYSKLQKDFSL